MRESGRKALREFKQFSLSVARCKRMGTQLRQTWLRRTHSCVHAHSHSPLSFSSSLFVPPPISCLLLPFFIYLARSTSLSLSLCPTFRIACYSYILLSLVYLLPLLLLVFLPLLPSKFLPRCQSSTPLHQSSSICVCPPPLPPSSTLLL